MEENTAEIKDCTGASYTILPATTEMAAQIAELERICFSDPWSEELLCESIRHPLYRFPVVCDGAKVLGYGGMFLTLPEAQIANIAVASEARRRGIGTGLLRALCSEAEAAGAEVIFLEVREHNTGAIALYEKEGFTRVGMRRNYYSNPTENGFIYQKTIPRPAAI